MEEAAAQEKFERAGVLRDQIQALNKVRERQKIISIEEEDQDILGVVRQGSEACVQLFFVRQGRLLGREAFFFDKLAGRTDGEILSAFVRQFYAKNVMPPREILLSRRSPRRSSLGEWLAQLPGRPGGARRCPSAGASASSSRMAEENAALALQTHLLVARRPPAGRAGGAPARARACPGRPTASRASTSPTSRGRSRSARWSCGRTAP